MVRREALFPFFFSSKKSGTIAFHNVNEMVQDRNRKTSTYFLPVVLRLAIYRETIARNRSVFQDNAT